MSVTLNFDDIPSNVAVTTQYATRGIVFNTINGQAPRIDFNYLSFNGPWVLGAVRAGPQSYTISATFFMKRTVVSFLIRNSDVVTATLLDQNEVPFQTTSVNPGIGFHWINLISNEGKIMLFTLSSQKSFQIDNLVFDDTSADTVPDFLLLNSGIPIVMKPGGWATATVELVRLDGSSGPINLDSWFLPDGVDITVVTPDPYISLQSGQISVTFVTDPGRVLSEKINNRRIPVTWVPGSASAGSRPQTVNIPITVLEPCNVRIFGLEVTQGVQVFQLPRKFSPFQDEPSPYNGVRLAAGGKTIVRAFCTLMGPPLVHQSLPKFNCFLYGFNSVNSADGTPLPGSPLLSENEVPITNNLSDTTSFEVRGAPNTSANFTLPPSWTTGGPINLRAELRPNPTPFPPAVYDDDPGNNTYTMVNIPFNDMLPVYIHPVHLQIATLPPPADPTTVFAKAQNILPLADGGFRLSAYYGTTIDIQDIFNGTGSSDSKGVAAVARLQDIADDWGILHFGNGFVVGVFNIISGIRGETIPAKRASFFSHPLAPCSIVRDTTRGLSSVTHEIGHLLGRKHASSFGGAKEFEDWPNSCGLLDGAGVDRSTGETKYPKDTCAAVNVNGFYDYMSYDHLGATDPDQFYWISCKGWEEEVQRLLRKNSQQHLTLLGSGVLEETKQDLLIIVHVIIRDGGQTEIVKVAPLYNSYPTKIDEESTIEIIIMDNSHPPKEITRRGTVFTELADETSTASILHKAFIPLSQWDNIGSVEIHQDEKNIASRHRPKYAPTITSVNVIPNGEGPSSWTVTWQAQHPSVEYLWAKVDLKTTEVKHSSPPERLTPTQPTWAPIFSGLNKGIARDLPNAIFPHSKDSRIRVRISDGFNEIISYSKPFSTPGSAPHVQIRSPTMFQQIKARSTIYLSCEASDDTGTKLSNEEVRWHIDGKDMCRGNIGVWNTGVDDIGVKRICAEALDYRGRKSTAEVYVKIEARTGDEFFGKRV